MQRHAHFGGKGGNPTFAAGAKALGGFPKPAIQPQILNKPAIGLYPELRPQLTSPM
jgi:hypothetical protein